MAPLPSKICMSSSKLAQMAQLELRVSRYQDAVPVMVLAQLLAWNNLGDPLINLLNPTQQPPVQPQEPLPVPHNDHQHAPALKKMVTEQRGAPPLHHNTTFIPHPLNTNITLEPYPIGFKIPQLETYNGTKDPVDHLHAFYSSVEEYALSQKPVLPKNQNPDWRDEGSASDIIYYHFFESLWLDPALLQKYDGPIYGFKNQPVKVERVLILNVAFGNSRTYVNPSVRFLVVKMASSFNVVIGQPTLIEIRAVVSQSRLCMKFPTPMRTATLREERAEQIAFLRANKDVFAWILANMPRIPTSEEVEKLLQADFVRRVDYCELVANPVLVKKANSKWRMCIDYTNLNQACLKDYYPMPNIDKLVEAAFENERLNLLDAYSGYHQVPMAPEDEKKTSFYIGRNLEIYVDDIVVKSMKAEDHLADLDETFNNLKKNRMRLNPTKCIFRVEFGKFLGFMVSKRGIEINPEKIKVVAEMEQPKSIKDVNSVYEVVDSIMVKYVALVAELNSRSVFVEGLDEPSFQKPKMMEISTDPNTPSWTDPIVSFLRDGSVLRDKQEEMRLRKKASRTLAHKVLKQGYYWPNMYKDATSFVQSCPKCQFFAHLTHQLAEELTNLVAPWPFAQWGLDLLGPFMKGIGHVIHLIVGIDYFTKLIKAWPLSSLTSKKVEDFVFSSIICKYWILNQIVADNGTQFNCSSFRDFCFSYGIKLQFTSIYHLESNGMVESVNKAILEGIKPRLEQHKASTKVVIPIEIGVTIFRVTHFDEGRNGQLLRENLDLLDEVREEA
ncbi:hypothetical protein SLEP1_g1796 [Rubroshorea leprosula]|uniref:Integrase catalytic domain-containing protein n=1 Tax=Rubroshorea leprosula TaxID=152421 RepID=A0AAV5HKW4_9ROSI|nr:hypothetical protein SLEP1_g1796 [Rubroshorea leprosula]